MSIAPAPGTVDIRLQRVLAILLVLVAVLQVASFAWAVPSNDYARDLLVAAQIADGEALPLQGPIINATVHLGPAWHYLLAIPVGLGLGFVGTTVFVGALSTLKIAVAWRFGGLLGGRALAIAFAALMLVPGWGLMHLLQLTHTVVLETMVIACLIPLLRLWRGEPGRAWVWFGLLWGLAVHAHPVSLLLGVPALAVWFRHRANWRGDLAWIVIGAMLALAPAVPALVAVWLSGASGPDVSGMVGGSGGVFPLLPMLAMLQGLIVGGVAVVQAVAVPRLDGVILVLFALLALVSVSGVPALWRNGGLRAAGGVVLGSIFIGALWLVLLRQNVSFYMAALVWPLVVLACALPLAAVVASPRAGKARFLAGVFIALALGAIGSGAMIAQSQNGHAELPLSGFQDIGAKTQPLTPLALMPTWAFEKRARISCGLDTLLVHGELAALVDFYQGMPFSWTCGAGLRVRLMGADGSEGTAHWAGTTPHTLHLLGLHDAGWRQALVFAPARVIHPAESMALAPGDQYPHRDVGKAAPEPHDFRFEAQSDEAVAVYAPLFAFDASQVVEARANGAPVAPASVTNSGALYLPPAQATGPVEWTVATVGREPQQIDIVTLRTGKR